MVFFFHIGFCSLCLSLCLLRATWVLQCERLNRRERSVSLVLQQNLHQIQAVLCANVQTITRFISTGLNLLLRSACRNANLSVSFALTSRNEPNILNSLLSSQNGKCKWSFQIKHILTNKFSTISPTRRCWHISMLTIHFLACGFHCVLN